MRRLISAIVLALATGCLIYVSPVASAAQLAHLSAAPGSRGDFGVRLVDVPVSEADNPRALTYIIDDLPTGTVIHRRILIVNEEPRTAHFTVYADAAHITGGLFTGYGGATRDELTTWISVEHRKVTLAAGESVMDRITIKVPRGATRGEHYGVIWVQQAARGHTSTGFGVTEVSRVGVRVYLAVGRGGVLPTSFDITSITGRWSASGQPLIVAHVNNTGGRAVDLSGTVSLADGPGNTRAGPFRAEQIVTLAPGQSWNVAFAVPKSLPDGSWQAKVTLLSGLTKATGSAAIRIGPIVAAAAGLSAMQWIWLAVGGLAVVLAIVMWQYALRHRRRRALA